MRLPFVLLVLLILLIGAFSGCQSPGKTETANPSSQSGAAQAAAQYQYRAICLDKESHGGNVQVLSKWLDEREKAEALGKYHGDFKNKGHLWKIEERVKPANAGQ